MRGGGIRFGPFGGAGERAVSLVSGATVGVGKTVRGCGTRRTGVSVGNGFVAGSVAVDGVAVTAGVSAGDGGVLR
jgi:hypothetical protein